MLRSAIANAENKSEDVDVDKLFVTEAYVNEGPRQKRIRPAPMGRAYRYQRRMAHIVVKLGEQSRSGRGIRVSGSESTSLRVPPRRHQNLALALVRQAGLFETAARRSGAEGIAARSRLKAAGVSSIEVDRPGNKLRITIRTSRPGIIIGRKGAEIEKLKSDLAKKTKREVFIDIQEVHRPELDAQLVSESIALQLEKRVAFRRAMRKAVDSALRFGCKGIKVRVSGPLNGAEIARSEWYLQGQLPLHTLARGYRLRLQPGIHDLWRDRREGLDLQGRSARRRQAAGTRCGTKANRAAAAGMIAIVTRRRSSRKRRRPASRPVEQQFSSRPSDLPKPASVADYSAALGAVAPSWKQERRRESSARPPRPLRRHRRTRKQESNE